MNKSNWGLSRAFHTGYALLIAVGFSAATFAGCMDRPVVPADPKTSNVSVQAVSSKGVDKIDLLFVVDNSISMADKQQILKDAVPVLVRRLVQPTCVSSEDGQKTAPRLADGKCPANFGEEFEPIEDIHIGVISSSLGDYGGTACASGEKNDQAHLIGIQRKLPSWNDTGFLAWGPEAGVTNVDTLVSDFSTMIVKTGEAGCGYEATLESWYRFLIDPEPPLAVKVEDRLGKREGIDEALLEQRKKFLRPDSLVAVIMLTDENDCSIADVPYGHFATTLPNQNANGKVNTIWSGTSACDEDPNDKCCQPCINEDIPGCTKIADDPACKPNTTGHGLPAVEDNANLRCWEQKRRFGYDFLFPVQRYVDGLTKDKVRAQDGTMVPNPLFEGRRDKGLVFLAGIVGVPWQDIADEASLKDDARLRFLNAKELSTERRWDEILGDPQARVLPFDPLMVESPFPRSGRNEALAKRLEKAGRSDNISIAPATSENPRENVVNGHEFKVRMAKATAEPDELQYACIFERSEPLDCPADGSVNCDCKAASSTEPDEHKNSPLCQPPSGGPFEPKQYFGKAYPGTRHLEVLKGIGDNAIVASICPKVPKAVSETAKLDPSYGYNPAVAAIIDQLKQKFDGGCLTRELIIDDREGSPNFGKVGCAVVEAIETDEACSCDAIGRSPARPELVKAVRSQLSAGGQCSGAECDSYCMCELDQLVGDAGGQCQNADAVGEDIAGYCYIDAQKKDADGKAAPIGDPKFAQGCSAGRKLRFVGNDTPVNGSFVYMACAGQATFREGQR